MTHTRLQELLEDATQTGIFHLPESGRTAVRQAAEAAGMVCFEVSFADLTQIDAILSGLGRDLDFPEWYGKNFDALKDCLTDFSWCEAAGYVLIIAHAEALQRENPDRFHTLNQVFTAAIEEWREHDFPMWIFYDLRTNGLATLPTLT